MYQGGVAEPLAVDAHPGFAFKKSAAYAATFRYETDEERLDMATHSPSAPVVVANVVTRSNKTCPRRLRSARPPPSN